MKDYFISYGTGLSSDDSKSTKNINVKFLCRGDNSGWNILINNKPLFGIWVNIFIDDDWDDDDTEYHFIIENEPYQSFQLRDGGMDNPYNLVDISERLHKYFENNLEVWN